jgi:putative endonuclease
MPDTRPWYFYILRCRDNSLYAGIALDPKKRLEEHNAGQGANFTARRRPVSLVYYEKHSSMASARKRENQVKGWRIEKKEQLLAGFLRLRQS